MGAHRILPVLFICAGIAAVAGCSGSAGYGKYGKSAGANPGASPAKTEAVGPAAAAAPEKSGSAAVTHSAKASAPETPRVKVQPTKPRSEKPRPEKSEVHKSAPEPRAPAHASQPAVNTPVQPESQAEEAPVMVSLDNMPLTIDGEWVLDRNETRCSLSSVPLKMDDGQGGTEVSLLLKPDQLLIHTRSAIDLSYTGTGVAIGDSQFTLETVANDTDLSFTKQRATLLAAMSTGSDLKLTVGFWPTWPVTHTYSIDIPLRHFAPAMQAWETCNRLLSGK